MKKIVTNQNTYMEWANKKVGENLVFEYVFSAADDEAITDDEYSETIRFEIPANLQEFSYQNEELTETKVTLTKSCFCYFPLTLLK